MMAKPRTAAGYDATHVTKVREACLYLATKVGDLLGELVIVGGLVPSLIVDQRQEGLQRHIGTLDLDVGMEVAILEEGRYAELTERLRAAGFGPDTNERGNITRQRWKIDGPPKVTLDFLIAPTRPDDEGGHLRNLQDDFAAVIAPGLRLAFRDSKTVRLAERTIRGERAERSVLVCGAGAFVVMKALAFRNRGENKDAYDLSYVVRNYGEDVGDVAGLLAPLMEDPEAQKAVGFLREDFAAIDSLGPRRVSEFPSMRDTMRRKAKSGRRFRTFFGSLTKRPDLTARSGRILWSGRSTRDLALRRDRCCEAPSPVAPLAQYPVLGVRRSLPPT